jgi:hypothetical protein
VSLDLPKNKQQQLLVDDHLRLIGDPTGSVFALGDCSYIEDKPLPPTAQVAERQGRYLAKSLSQFPVMTYAPPMQFESLGMLAYVGDYQAVTDLPQFKFGGCNAMKIVMTFNFCSVAIFIQVSILGCCGALLTRLDLAAGGSDCKFLLTGSKRFFMGGTFLASKIETSVEAVGIWTI